MPVKHLCAHHGDTDGGLASKAYECFLCTVPCTSNTSNAQAAYFAVLHTGYFAVLHTISSTD